MLWVVCEKYVKISIFKSFGFKNIEIVEKDGITIITLLHKSKVGCEKRRQTLIKALKERGIHRAVLPSGWDIPGIRAIKAQDIYRDFALEIVKSVLTGRGEWGVAFYFRHPSPAIEDAIVSIGRLCRYISIKSAGCDSFCQRLLEETGIAACYYLPKAVKKCIVLWDCSFELPGGCDVIDLTGSFYDTCSHIYSISAISCPKLQDVSNYYNVSMSDLTAGAYLHGYIKKSEITIDIEKQ